MVTFLCIPFTSECAANACPFSALKSEYKIQTFSITLQVRKVLTILIQHNLVSFVKSKRGLTEYFLESDAVLLRNRIPRYIHCAKSLYGDAAELVIEDVLHHGQVTMMSVVNSVTDKLNEALENAGMTYLSVLVFQTHLAFCS